MGVEYNGEKYCGWQLQDHSPSVQAEIEKAVGKVANHPVRVFCAGRTDTGVHGIGQVIHFDTDAERTPHSWVYGSNANLPKDIAVLWAQVVSDEFHARYSALRRRYRYVILNRRIRPAILSSKVSWEYRHLDEARMLAAAAPLLGEHDFSSYRAVACQAKSPVRHLYRLDVVRRGDLITLDLEANGFLHHMVRNIAGVLMTIGAGEAEPSWSREVLDKRDRTCGGITAPAEGLYFMGVEYPSSFDIPVLLSPVLVW
jgi:tRNA pseudouridine38-40 synthase